VPEKKIYNGIPAIGDERLINQLGKRGVVLKNNINVKRVLFFSSTFLANL